MRRMPHTTTDRRIAIIGLGYVGLPLALAFNEAGLEGIGVDASDARVAELCAGRSPIDDVDDDRLARGLTSGLRILSSQEADLDAVDAAFVCVPPPITATKDPDLGPVLAAADYLCSRVREGQLIVLQSTTFPGTTVGPFPEAPERGRLPAGADLRSPLAP